MLANLGFVPPDLDLAAIEITWRTIPEEMREKLPYLARWPMITSGDVHRLSETRASTRMRCAEPSFEEIALDFRGEGRREVLVVT